MTPRPQSSAYPKFDSGLVSVHTSSGLGQQEGFLGMFALSLSLSLCLGCGTVLVEGMGGLLSLF